MPTDNQRRESQREARRRYYARNREKEAARKRKWELVNGARLRAQRKARLLTDPEYAARQRAYRKRWHDANKGAAKRSPHHGKTPDAIAQLLLTQGGKCAICGATNGDSLGRWFGDHDHVTGAFRGVLCQRCNVGLGYFRDCADNLVAAAAYLRRAVKLAELL